MECSGGGEPHELLQLGLSAESETGNALKAIYFFLMGSEMYQMFLFSTLTLLVLHYNTT